MQDESGKAASGSPAEASTSTAQVGAEVCCSHFSLLSPQQAHNYVWVLQAMRVISNSGFISDSSTGAGVAVAAGKIKNVITCRRSSNLSVHIAISSQACPNLHLYRITVQVMYSYSADVFAKPFLKLSSHCRHNDLLAGLCF